MSEFRFGEHGGVLTFAYGASTYDFRLSVNGEEIPEEDIESTTEYTAGYTCSPTRLVLSTDSNRVEYARD
jgi:hypothetical protein